MSEVLPLLEAKNLRVVRGRSVVLDVPFFSVYRGEIVALIGPNGAGKTTLLHTLAWLTAPFDGELWFQGQKVEKDMSILEYRRKLSMAFQESLLFDTTVFENVAAGLRLRGMGRAEIAEGVMTNLELFGILHLKDRSARTLSGGEAQRTSLARALAVKPSLLLLDEPFASLDPPTRESLLDDLHLIVKRTNTTLVLATHDRQDALRLSQRIAVIRKGTVLQIGATEDVVNHPLDEYVAAFVGVETVMRARIVSVNGSGFIADVNGKRVEVVGTARQGEEVTLCVRPENVVLSRHISGDTSARNWFQGNIVRVSRFGPYQKIDLDVGFPLVSYVTAHSVSELALHEGGHVAASFKATAVQVIRRSEAPT